MVEERERATTLSKNTNTNERRVAERGGRVGEVGIVGSAREREGDRVIPTFSQMPRSEDESTEGALDIPTFFRRRIN